MGAEFLSRTRPTIRKHIDVKRVALATPDLLTVVPTDQPRIFLASLSKGASVASGESLIAQTHQGQMLLLRGNTLVGALDNPPADVVRAVENSGGIANGIVHRVHRLSKKADISLC